MMMNFRGLFFKYGTPALIAAACLTAGCGSGKSILFCEGVSPEGEGINCGTRFETGDLTALIKPKKPFGVKSIEIRIQDSKSKKDSFIEKITAGVKPEDERAVVNLSFYREGKFRVMAVEKDEVLAEGDIEIVDF
ncbi:MAG: hypothetical protein MUD12_07660 [Spirochaetes bacterium]|jgi:hypothetical protein|nr:hypothetical protein [Spirochaetota bacterium]